MIDHFVTSACSAPCVTCAQYGDPIHVFQNRFYCGSECCPFCRPKREFESGAKAAGEQMGLL